MYLSSICNHLVRIAHPNIPTYKPVTNCVSNLMDFHNLISKIHDTRKALCISPLLIFFFFLNYMNFTITNLTLQMLRLLSSKAQRRKDFWKPSKTCHVGILWIALAVYRVPSSLCLYRQHILSVYIFSYHNSAQIFDEWVEWRCLWSTLAP